MGEGGFEPTVGFQRVGLALGDVVGGDQLRPHRFAVRVLGGQRLQFADHRVASAAGDFGLGAGGLRHHLVLGERGGQRVDEVKIPQVVKYWSAPFGQRRAQVPAGLFETPCRRGDYTGSLLSDESA